MTLHRAAAALALLLFAATPSALGEGLPTTASAAPSPTVKSDDEFDLLAPPAALDPAAVAKAKELDEALGRRRRFLEIHQVLGFVNLAGLATTVVLGQLNYSDKYAGGGDTGKYVTAHETAAYIETGIFAATGLFAMLAPSPIDKPLRFETATVHRALMGLATVGFVTQIVLGTLAATHEGSIRQRDYALAHQIVGYTTLVATTGGFLVLTF